MQLIPLHTLLCSYWLGIKLWLNMTTKSESFSSNIQNLSRNAHNLVSENNTRKNIVSLLDVILSTPAINSYLGLRRLSKVEKVPR